MPSSTADILVANLASPALTLTLRRRSPFWELTIQNNRDLPVYVDNRESLPANGGKFTICRRSRRPSFTVQISNLPTAWYTPGNWANKLQISPPTSRIDAPTVTVTDVFSAVAITTLSFVRPIHRTALLPLEATVSPTVITLKNTSTDTTLQYGEDPMYPGDTLFIGHEDAADIPPIRTPDGTVYSVAAAVTTGLSVTLVSPPPAAAAMREAEGAPAVGEGAPADPDFDAATFFPHVLQQLHFRDPALLTDILRTQGFTPGQIAAFLAAVTEF